jgi:7,8-dihydroneopterin 2',3'-cyclic phosphate phosphodiesterase
MKDDVLLKIAEDIKDPSLREKVTSLIKDPKLTMLDNQEPNRTVAFKESPASKRRHHSYESGLIVHSLATAKIAISLADILEDVYKVKVNRDVVIASALLHDLFKYYTYSMVYPGKYSVSKLGENLDHLSLIVMELYARKFPIDVIHAVAAHHGDASPVQPGSLEALIVHMSDYVDATMNDKALFAAKDIIRDCLMKEIVTLPKEVSPFDVITTKKEGGCEEIRRRFAAKI